MNRTSISESKDRAVWEGWFKEAQRCKLEDGSLQKFLDHLKNDYEFDYGTSARATAAAAFATANAFASYIGLTGFLWSCAAMDILGRMQFPDNKLGYRVVNYDDLLYPQYQHRFTEIKISQKGAETLKQEAQKLIDEGGPVHPDVLAWWKGLAEGKLPYWLLIKEGGAE